uniref:Uncharacterized protein n=1 Tax=Ditylenchus dipsaci TaxID=166011 RepID=A0A915EIB3_9BILA
MRKSFLRTNKPSVMSHKIFIWLANICLCIYLPTSALKCYQSSLLNMDHPVQGEATECSNTSHSCLFVVRLGDGKIDRQCHSQQCSPDSITYCSLYLPENMNLNGSDASFMSKTSAVAYMLALPKPQDFFWCCCKGDGCNDSEVWNNHKEKIRQEAIHKLNLKQAL